MNVTKSFIHTRLKKYFLPDHTSLPEATNPGVIEQPCTEAKDSPSDQVEEMVCHTKSSINNFGT